jgi:hypothetical protein
MNMVEKIPFAGMVKSSLADLRARYFARAVELEGNLKGTEIPFRCWLVGENTITKRVYHRMYEGTPTVRKREWVSLPGFKERLAHHAEGLDLCLAVLPKEYESTLAGAYSYLSSEKVRQVIETSGTWEQVRSGFVHKKQQITNNFSEKYGLEYRISHDPSDLAFFYERMFVPHIRRRYGELSIIEPYEKIKPFFEKGMLLFVRKNGVDVAGALSLIQNETLVFRRTGVLDGDESHVEAGAQTALYYYQIKYANENGLRAVDAMMSHPFLNDGVFRHKKEWGATVLSDDESYTWVYLFHLGPSAKLAKFYEDNPMVISTVKGLQGLVGLSGKDNSTQDVLKVFSKRYACKGLEGFVLIEG